MLRVGPPRGPRRFGPPGPLPRFGPPRGPRRFGGPPRPLFIVLMIIVFLMIIGAMAMLMPGNNAKPVSRFKYNKKAKSPKNRRNKK